MTNTELKKYKAIIFDMDGVLIDSEPLWKIAMEEVFFEIGCKLTRKDFEKTVGLRLDEVISYWYKHFPWEEVSPEEVLERIIQKMIVLIQQNGEPLLGVINSLNYFKSTGFKIGLATSSYEVLIETVLETLNIKHFFDLTHSAEHENFGKPHPEVYINTAKMLKVEAQECIVIEDSINGVIAGKAARMHVICIPEKSHAPNSKLVIADELFENLEEMLEEMKIG
ncbi:MAG: hexitol phosphatase HxpB [Bacteroidota bacterium]